MNATLTRATALLADQRAKLEGAISILETDRLAVMDLNLARDLRRRVVGWQARLNSCPAIADIILGEHSMWAPLIRITVEDAQSALCEHRVGSMDRKVAVNG